MAEGRKKYYTVDFENLSEENVRDYPDNIVKMSFWFDDEADINLKNLGLCFEDKEKAIDKAKEIYYNAIWEANTFVWKDRSNTGVTLNFVKNFITPEGNPRPGDRCAETPEKLYEIIDQIGRENIVKYILKLSDVYFYMPIYVK